MLSIYLKIRITNNHSPTVCGTFALFKRLRVHINIATPVSATPRHLPPQKHSRTACLKRCALLLVSSPHSCPLAVPGDSPLRGSLSDRCANKCSLHPPPAALVCVARFIRHWRRFGGSPPVSERANAPHILGNTHFK